MADATDYFHKVGDSTATTLSAPGYTTGATSINVGSTTNWPTDTGVTFCIDEVDGDGERIAGTYNVFRGLVTSGTQVSSLTYVGGDANRNYSAGATTRVFIHVGEDRENRLVDGLLISHDQSGNILADNTATFSSNIDVNDASTAIRDSSDNELVKFVKTTSAVNEITVTNNSTGNSPSISATGGDINVGLTLATKADGLLRLGGMRVQNDTTNSTGTGLVIQHGWGWVIGPAAANSTTESITFPTAFSSAPIVILGKLGDRSGSDPSAIGDLTTTSGAYAEAEDITTSGFVAGILSRDAGSNLSNTVRYGYSWIAIGVV